MHNQNGTLSHRRQYRLCACLIFSLSLFFATASHPAPAQGICDRSEQVATAIVNALSDADSCAQVTRESLASILYLDISGSGISSLRTHDFSGLLNLIDLDLENNSLEELASGQFNELQSAEIIRLTSNRISSLPQRAFANLPNLRILKLANNRLYSISNEVFVNLPSLYELDLRGNPVSIPSDGILSGLPRLESLGVDKERIGHINPVIFGHVRFLQLDSYDSGVQVHNALVAPQSGAAGGTVVYEIRTSRLFGARNQYPPKGFSGYAIVAFSSGSTQDSVSRYKAICEGYLNTLTASKEVVDDNVPTSAQLATIWPLRTAAMADSLNDTDAPKNTACGDIVQNIGIRMSKKAIRRAEMHLDEELTGDGPYLLGWAPGQRYDDASDDVPVLVLDLSNVRTSQQAVNAFNFWSSEIEKDPGVWVGGWNFGRLKLKVRWWVERYGEGILNFIGRFS